MRAIPYGKQIISEADIESVVQVLKSDFLTQGPVVRRFEKAIASYCGVDHALAVNSATSALHIACLALGVAEGDWVWTSPITFVASANCARYCGASVDFVDIDPRTFNMCPKALAQKLETAEKEGKLPKVVIPVHMAGQSCDMAAIHKLAQKYGFKIIEDASHAIGGSYKSKKVGCCEYSDIAVFSFHPVKIITTGEGGVAVTKDQALIKHMARLRSHGITRYPEEMTEPPEGSWFYQQIELGFNYRMTEIQAALGLSQMDQLDSFVAKRHELAKRYDEQLKKTDIQTPWQHPDCYSSRHLYVVSLPVGKGMPGRREVFENMRALGIGVNVHYIPVYKQPYYSAMGFKASDYPASEAYYAGAISIPLFPALTEEDQDYVVSALTSPSGYQTIF